MRSLKGENYRGNMLKTQWLGSRPESFKTSDVARVWGALEAGSTVS